MAEASGADFLLLNMDARVAAQGGAAVARPASLSGLRNNPAGLNGLQRVEAALTHFSGFGDWDNDWLALGLPWGSRSLGLELISARMRPFPYYDDLGREVGSLDASSLQGACSFSQRMGLVSMGITARVFRGQLAEYSNWGYAGDLGALWHPFRWLSVGGSLQHLGEQSAYYAIRDPLPSLGRIGFQVHDHSTPELGVSFDLDYIQSQDPARVSEARMGAEVELQKRLALRFGVCQQDLRWNPSFGLGFKFSGLDLSYAYRPIESLGADHLLTLGLLNWSALTGSGTP